MYSFNQLLAALAIVAVSLVEAMPTDEYLRDLSAVSDRTVCPIVEEVDEDATRIPRRIKVLKCGHKPLQHCQRLGVPEHECCHMRRDDARQTCAEVEDLVQVYYPAKKTSQSIRVAVGCVCVIEQAVQAEESSPGS